MQKLLTILLILSLLTLSACGTAPAGPELSAAWSEVDMSQTLTVSGDGIDGELSFSLEEMLSWEDAVYEGLYSSINNWPTAKTVAAGGVLLSAILQAAGVEDTAQVITISGDDGYQCSFTRRQLLEAQRHYYPEIAAENPTAQGAAPVPVILAAVFVDNSDDLADMQARTLMLIFGQEYVAERNYVGFVENVTSIEVSSTPAEAWAPPYIFPDVAALPLGETLKLQHDYYGQVKIFYTLDGSEPNTDSLLYNPSTYQPDLNKPLLITEDCHIRALAVGYGRGDSEIAEFIISVE